MDNVKVWAWCNAYVIMEKREIKLIKIGSGWNTSVIVKNTATANKVDQGLIGVKWVCNREKNGNKLNQSVIQVLHPCYSEKRSETKNKVDQSMILV